MTRLAVVVGSVRPNRVGGTIAQWVVDQANEIEGVEAEIVDIASFNLPLFAEEIPPRMAVPSDPAGAICGESPSYTPERVDQIAEAVGLSASAVLRRVRRLEDSGVIDRYVALVQPEAVGLGLTAYLNVRLEKHTESHKRNPMDLFRASVQTWPEVVECAALTGEMDFLLRVVVADMAHYRRFVMESLLKHPSVQDCKTSFVLDRVKATTALPV